MTGGEISVGQRPEILPGAFMPLAPVVLTDKVTARPPKVRHSALPRLAFHIF